MSSIPYTPVDGNEPQLIPEEHDVEIVDETEQTPTGPDMVATFSNPEGIRSMRFKLIAHRLGIAEVAFGIIMILTTVISLIVAMHPPPTLKCSTYLFCHPIDFGITVDASTPAAIWAGIFLFISGGLGVGGKRWSVRSDYRLCIWMSCLAWAMCLISVGVSVYAAVHEGRKYAAILVLQALLAVFGLAAASTCMAHSVCCRAGKRAAETELLSRVYNEALQEVMQNADYRTTPECDESQEQSNDNDSL